MVQSSVYSRYAFGIPLNSLSIQANDDVEVTKSIYNTFNMPLDLPDKPQYVLRIVSNGTDIFNAFDTESKFVLENKNIEQITVGNTDDYQNATTLAKALENRVQL